MPFIATEFPDLFVFEPVVFGDSRGYFFEAYNQKVHQAQGLSYNWVQDNQSSSSYGVIRGLHFQLPPYAQTKLVRALSGTILDIVVDMRKGSPSYGKSFSIELSAENKKQLLVPKGFAHGFSVLSERAEVLYKCDEFYTKESERGFIYNDPSMALDWKIEPSSAVVSEKDIILPTFALCENPFVF